MARDETLRYAQGDSLGRNGSNLSMDFAIALGVRYANHSAK